MLNVGVVIPAHNAATTVQAAVHSALLQVPPPAGVVVVDDGSRDGTGDVARQAGATVLTHPRALGPAAARHAGTLAGGWDATAYLDADDVMAPGHLAAATRILTARPEVSLVFGLSEEVHPDGSHRLLPLYKDGELETPLWALARNNLVPTSAAVVPAWAYQKAGGFTGGRVLDVAEDFDLWLRLSLLGPFACTHAPGTRRTITTGSTSRRPDALERMLANGLRVVEAMLPRLPPQDAARFAPLATAHVRREGARRFLANGLVQRAREEALLSVQAHPQDRDAWALLVLALAPGPARQAALALQRWRHRPRG